MRSAGRQRLVPLLLLNLLLIIILFFILDHFKIFSWKDFLFSSKKKKVAKVVVEDPFLLEKESLKKQWLVLREKERLYTERNKEFEKKENLLEEKLKEADKQIEVAKKMQKKQQELKKQYEDREANVRNLANKIGNMPPKDGVALLERMDAVLAVDVIRQMDKIATENDKKSITDYLLSIMKKDKAAKIIRLISRYPQDPDDKKNEPNQP